MNQITIPVNNKREITVRFNTNKNISIEHYNSKGIIDKQTKITQADFISMLNWYYYQKEKGNKDLLF